MKLALRCFALTLFLASLAVRNVLPVDGQDGSTEWRYAYILQQPSSIITDEIAIHLVDPAAPDAPPAIVTVPIPPEYGLIGSEASPDGRHVLLLLSTYPYYSLIRLVNLTTGQIDDIALNYVETYPYEYGPAWSPNSQYVAFSAIPLSTDQYGTYVYELATHRLNMVRAIVAQGDYYLDQPNRFVWSSDSAHLAIVSTNCQNTLCSPRFEVFGIPDAMALVSTTFQGITFPEHEVCNLDWSPDRKYISFEAICAVDSMYSHEVYVWDTEDNEIAQLTDLTNPLSEIGNPEAPIFGSMLDVFWYDMQHMLMGYMVAQGELGVGPIPDTFRAGTLVYRFPTGDSVMVSSESGVEWTPNPVSNEMAFRSELIAVDDTRQFAVTASVQIAAFDGQALTPLSTGPAGCDLRWSPDGATLGYAYVGPWTDSYTYCDSPLGFLFIDRLTGQIARHNLPDEQDIQTVGWVSVGPEYAPPAILPAVPPTPTRGPAG